jgi:hypothetical protein
MPAAVVENEAIQQQAIKALAYLSDEDKLKVLEYIDSLVNLHKIHNDQGSSI